MASGMPRGIVVCGRQMIGYAPAKVSLAKPPTTSDERAFARTFRGQTDLRPKHAITVLLNLL
jgi:hypothetical protein